VQEMLVHTTSRTYFKPPYVGARGWVGVVLDAIEDEELAMHIHEAWSLVAPARAVRNTAKI
jgi:hypothetical protein